MPKGIPGPEFCSIEGCGRPHRSLGLCNRHYLKQCRHNDPMGGGPARMTGDSPPVRFAAKVDLDGPLPPHDPLLGRCHVWTAGKVNGYGRFRVEGKTWNAHKWAWEQANGTVPDGLFVCHKCDNPSCVNLDHLYVGTPKDNISDMDARGRRVSRPAIGEASRSRFTTSQVRTMRWLVAQGAVQRQVAVAFGTSPSTLHNIVSRRTWSHV